MRRTILKYFNIAIGFLSAGGPIEFRQQAGSLAPFLTEEAGVVDTSTGKNGDRSEAGACTADEFKWISQRSRCQVCNATYKNRLLASSSLMLFQM